MGLFAGFESLVASTGVHLWERGCAFDGEEACTDERMAKAQPG